jgi:hypothetical protein
LTVSIQSSKFDFVSIHIFQETPLVAPLDLFSRFKKIIINKNK